MSSHMPSAVFSWRRGAAAARWGGVGSGAACLKGLWRPEPPGQPASPPGSCVLGKRGSCCESFQLVSPGPSDEGQSWIPPLQPGSASVSGSSAGRAALGAVPGRRDPWCWRSDPPPQPGNRLWSEAGSAMGSLQTGPLSLLSKVISNLSSDTTKEQVVRGGERTGPSLAKGQRHTYDFCSQSAELWAAMSWAGGKPPRWGRARGWGLGWDPAAAAAAVPTAGPHRADKGGVSKQGLTAFTAPTSLNRADEEEKRFSICLQRPATLSVKQS